MKKNRLITVFYIVIFSFLMIKSISLVDYRTVPAFDTDNINVKKTNYHIHINLDKKQLYLFKDNKFIKSYPVSGGKVSTPSPLGEWKIWYKSRWGEGFGGYWMAINVPWGKYGLHGTLEPAKVGKSNVSKGCIRLKNEDIKELYSIVPHGTTVKIIYENIPFRKLKAGCRGSDVYDLQTKLNELNYFPYYIDGIFGEYTKLAIIQYQKDNNLKVTGDVDKNLYDTILENDEAKDE